VSVSISFHRSAKMAIFPSASGVRALIATGGSRASIRSGYRRGNGWARGTDGLPASVSR